MRALSIFEKNGKIPSPPLSLSLSLSLHVANLPKDANLSCERIDARYFAFFYTTSLCNLGLSSIRITMYGQNEALKKNFTVDNNGFRTGVVSQSKNQRILARVISRHTSDICDCSFGRSKQKFYALVCHSSVYPTFYLRFFTRFFLRLLLHFILFPKLSSLIRYSIKTSI